jgi:hypothetical protein
VADDSIGSSGVIDISAAAYDTLGELCAYIDGETDYECELLAGKANDNSAVLRDQTETSGTNNLKAAGGFSVEFDTGSTVSASGAAIPYHLSVGRVPRPNKSLVLVSCEADANGSTPDLRVYGKLKVFDGVAGHNDYDTADLEEITDDTEVVVDWAVPPKMGGLEFAKGSHVVVRAGNETSAQASANDLRCWFIEK